MKIKQVPMLEIPKLSEPMLTVPELEIAGDDPLLDETGDFLLNETGGLLHGS